MSYNHPSSFLHFCVINSCLTGHLCVLLNWSSEPCPIPWPEKPVAQVLPEALLLGAPRLSLLRQRALWPAAAGGALRRGSGEGENLHAHGKRLDAYVSVNDNLKDWSTRVRNKNKAS